MFEYEEDFEASRLAQGDKGASRQSSFVVLVYSCSFWDNKLLY